MASRLRLAVTRLHRRLRQQGSTGLTQSQSSALASIDKLGSPTLGALAARESVQPPSMTRIVGGLEELGYVTRVVDPADRRVARVTISPAGRQVLHQSRSMKNAFLAQQLHRLPAGGARRPRGPHRAARATGGDGRIVTSLRAAARQTFSSLRTRNYRLYFTAQLISVSGTWMQTVAQAWLVLHLTGSSVDLGIVVGLQFLPMLLFGPFGGLVADRMNKRRLLYATQTAGGLLALVLGVLVVTHSVELWQVYLLATLLGVVNVFDNPARQTFVMEMVGPRRPAQRGEPQHRGDERVPGGRTGHRRRGHRPVRAGRLLLRQCRLLRGRARRPVHDAEQGAVPDPAGGPGQGSDPRGIPLRLAHPEPAQHPAGHRPHRHLRLQLHRHPGRAGQGHLPRRGRGLLAADLVHGVRRRHRRSPRRPPGPADPAPPAGARPGLRRPAGRGGAGPDAC